MIMLYFYLTKKFDGRFDMSVNTFTLIDRVKPSIRLFGAASLLGAQTGGQTGNVEGQKSQSVQQVDRLTLTVVQYHHWHDEFDVIIATMDDVKEHDNSRQAALVGSHRQRLYDRRQRDGVDRRVLNLRAW